MKKLMRKREDVPGGPMDRKEKCACGQNSLEEFGG